MLWVAQRTSTDCGIAIVAIVASVPYEVAKQSFDPFPGRGFRTEASDLRRALRRLGFQMGKSPRPLGGAIQIALESDAIALVLVGDRHGEEEGHWIVWDAEKQCLIDPARRRPKATYRFREYYKVKYTKPSPGIVLE